jgi:hypothetical protein
MNFSCNIIPQPERVLRVPLKVEEWLEVQLWQLKKLIMNSYYGLLELSEL